MIDFSKSNDITQNTFGGKITYKTTINNTGDFTHIDLGNVNEGVVKLFLNAKKVGVRWYGKAIFSISDFLIKGQNEIEIRYTTVLANYCKSLKDNPTTKFWTSSYTDKTPIGIEEPVQLFK